MKVKKRDEEKDVLMALKDGKDGEEKYTSKDLEIMIDCVNKKS